MAQNLTVRKGQCINFGNCKKADAREMMEVNLGDDFVCPECESDLVETIAKPSFPPVVKRILIAAGVLLVLVAGGFWGYRQIFSNVTDKVAEHLKPLTQSPLTPESITLDKTSLTFTDTGTGEQLTASVSPDSLPEKDKTPRWQSDNETVATVDSNGLVTALAGGSAVISASLGNGLSAKCEVEVKVRQESEGDSSGEAQDKKEGGNVSISVEGGKYTGQIKNGKPHGMGTVRYSSRTLIDSRDMKKRHAEAGQYITGEFYNGRLVQGKLFDSKNNQLETVVLGRVN
ncbi:MAG: Ig-like domain-containing protein [Prevotellaceae bacterium]|jgi:hypothetical protein|nr:Ig-like domain-containing protein [Prevotellaceae bacterium]